MNCLLFLKLVLCTRLLLPRVRQDRGVLLLLVERVTQGLGKTLFGAWIYFHILERDLEGPMRMELLKPSHPSGRFAHRCRVQDLTSQWSVWTTISTSMEALVGAVKVSKLITPSSPASISSVTLWPVTAGLQWLSTRLHLLPLSPGVRWVTLHRSLLSVELMATLWVTRCAWLTCKLALCSKAASSSTPRWERCAIKLLKARCTTLEVWTPRV